MDKQRILKNIAQHYNTVYNSLSGVEVCCTTTALCKEAMTKALTLAPLVEAIPLVQKVMSHYCFDNSQCNSSLDDVAYRQHDIAIAYTKAHPELSDFERLIVGDLCLQIHMDIVQCDFILEAI